MSNDGCEELRAENAALKEKLAAYADALIATQAVLDERTRELKTAWPPDVGGYDTIIPPTSWSSLYKISGVYSRHVHHILGEHLPKETEVEQELRKP
jgi:hypothetical protein